MNEKWGCFKHIGMSYEMYMSLPIHERREFINKHNREQEAIEKRSDTERVKNSRTYDGESLNEFARLEQSNKKRG